MRFSEDTSASTCLNVYFSRALVWSLCRMDLLEPYNSSFLYSINWYVSNCTKFCQLSIYVLTNFFTDCELCSSIIRCLDSQILDINWISSILNLGSAQLWHLNVSRCTTRIIRLKWVLHLDLSGVHPWWWTIFLEHNFTVWLLNIHDLRRYMKLLIWLKCNISSCWSWSLRRIY